MSLKSALYYLRAASIHNPYHLRSHPQVMAFLNEHEIDIWDLVNLTKFPSECGKFSVSVTHESPMSHLQELKSIHDLPDTEPVYAPVLGKMELTVEHEYDTVNIRIEILQPFKGGHCPSTKENNE